MEKYGLVLEGGGVRGAYTAGALAWLSDHHVTFDYGVGISSGAMYMTCYWQRETQMAYEIAIQIRKMSACELYCIAAITSIMGGCSMSVCSGRRIIRS